ncbi:uncharacterized protein PV06_04068 [Exophiala oligosperma]|uniref:Uncharacterized protein n=1 Tax=Exophiala oligosperma TaxID=215243 RepID=A0A0D2DT63_9EURO|nr:uncharacterized protein PV06_04068 [Exophiala oligosperma]KIW45700.1 hypothetical protein PV06_04068 [Exophiala oligosperma]
MAEPGFPWTAQTRDSQKEETISPSDTLDPSHVAQQEVVPGAENRASTADHQPQLKKPNNSQCKRRNGSVKGPHRVIPTISGIAADSSTTNTNQKPGTPLPVRTIPAWVRDAEESDLDDPQFEALDSPVAALVAQHNHSPATTRHPNVQSRHPHRNGHVISAGHVRPERTSRWVSFARASAYPRETFEGEKVDAEYLNEHFTDYSRPWLAGHEDDLEDGSSRYRAFRRKRKIWYKRAQFTILRNPFIPLAFRLTIFAFAFVALGLGTSIYHSTNRIVECIDQNPRDEACRNLVGNSATKYYQDPSGLMAMIVDAIAVAYTLYITYDEYFSKPLGLRPARAKVRLVLLDLFFVVFQSANLALSFESLAVDQGACKVGSVPYTSPRFDTVCSKERALSGVLLVSLVAWLMTFSISVLRLVERIDTK